MINAIKAFFKQKELNGIYLEEINKLRQQLSDEQKKAGDPRYVIEKVLGRGINYFDHSKLSKGDRAEYFKQAQAALTNKTVQNEVNEMMSDWISYAAKQSEESTIGFRSVRDVRMCICAIQLFTEKLSDIQDPNEKQEVKDPNSPI